MAIIQRTLRSHCILLKDYGTLSCSLIPGGWLHKTFLDSVSLCAHGLHLDNLQFTCAHVTSMELDMGSVTLFPLVGGYNLSAIILLLLSSVLLQSF